MVVVCDETATPVDAQEQQSRHTLTVFDVSNKFSAFTAPLKPIKAVLSEWGLLFAISEDNDRLYCVRISWSDFVEGVPILLVVCVLHLS